jgi:ABC-type branched-subunit amino acid transport system permease subunit
VGLPALRLRGLQLAIVTLVVNLSVSTYLLSDRYLGSALPARVGRPRGFGLRLDDERTFFYVVLLVVALGYAAILGLRRSALARELLATRDNETAAQAFGVAPVRARLSAFAIAGALAGLAGALLAYQQHSVLVDSFSPDRSVSLFLYAVIGGFGAPAGALVAGGFYAAVTVFGWPTAVTQALTGIGGLALLILSRGGLMQALAGWRDSWLRSVARRHRLSVRSLGTDASDAATRRLAIAPKVRTGGATVFVVPRYRVDGQYGMTPPPPTDVSHG